MCGPLGGFYQPRDDGSVLIKVMKTDSSLLKCHCVHQQLSFPGSGHSCTNNQSLSLLKYSLT